MTDYDVNDDDVVDADDAARLVEIILGKASASPGFDTDFNADSETNILDVMKVVSATLPAGEIIPSARRIDWTYAGIPGGIPTYTKYATEVDAQTYGGGNIDATSHIQGLLDSCAQDYYVYAPAGTYRIDGTLIIRSRKMLKGAGQGVTTLTKGGTSNVPLVYLGNGGIWDDVSGSPDPRVISSAVKNSSLVTLEATPTGITTGDLMILTQVNSGDVTNYGYDGSQQTNGGSQGITGLPWGVGTRSLGQFIEISGISGNDLSTTFPLHWTSDINLTPWAYHVPVGDVTSKAGLENLTVTQPSAIASHLIWLYGARQCWVKDVEISNVWADAIWGYFALQCEFSRNYVHTPVSGFGNSAAYGIVLSMYCTNCLVEDNILSYIGIAGIENHGGSSGNVMGYNFFYDLHYSSDSYLAGGVHACHGAHPKMNLWEGNVANKGAADYIWGSSSHNTYFRNYFRGWQSDTQTICNSCVQVSKKQYYYNIVGNVLGTSGKPTMYQVAPNGDGYTPPEYVSYTTKVIYMIGVDWQGAGAHDSGVEPTLLRHGNYDYVNNGIIWDSSIANHTIPNSLYLTGKPTWWGTEPWPPIGPDLAPMVSNIPAKTRYEAM